MESTGVRSRTRSIERILVTVVLAVLVLSSSMMTARAEAQANGSFETGDFSGWLLAGTSAASIVGLSFGTGPTDGAFQALVTNGPGVTVPELRVFFAVSGSALPALGNGTPTQGAGVRQVFDAPAGTPFVVDWNFLTNEAPSGSFNDFGFAVVEGVATTLANTHSALLTPFSPAFNRQTGFQQFCFVAPGGIFSVGFGIVDVGDTTVD